MFTRDNDIRTCRNDAGIECSKYVEHNYIVPPLRGIKKWSVSIAKYALVPCYKDLSIEQECSLKRRGTYYSMHGPKWEANTACT